jgi:hypothetical protein
MRGNAHGRRWISAIQAPPKRRQVDWRTRGIRKQNHGCLLLQRTLTESRRDKVTSRRKRLEDPFGPDFADPTEGAAQLEHTRQSVAHLWCGFTFPAVNRTGNPKGLSLVLRRKK